MKEFSSQKWIRRILAAGLIMAALLWGAAFFLRNFADEPDADPRAQNSYSDENYSAEEAHPEAYAFLINYFDQIERGNYEVLASRYWTSDVPKEILQTCSSPLSEGPEDASQLWAACGYLRGIDLEIVDIIETSDGYEAVIQLFDEQGEILNKDLHPEFEQGRKIQILRQDTILKTSDWNFLKVL